MQETLLSFVGNRDPHRTDPAGADEPEPGPVLSLLGARALSTVILFCTGTAYIERARTVEELARGEGYPARFRFVTIDLDSPIDYEEIFAKLTGSLTRVEQTFAHTPHHLSILLDPGTPPMQTAWFLLVASGRLEATLLQGVPPKFAAGAYKVKEVDLSRNLFPGIRRVHVSSGSREGPQRVYLEEFGFGACVHTLSCTSPRRRRTHRCDARRVAGLHRHC